MIEQDAFRVCRLMRETDFIKFCKERNVRIDAARLRRFEQLDVFRPLLRVHKPDVTIKFESTDEGIRDRGVLDDDETWNGETRVEMAQFDPTTYFADNWREYGSVWIPGQGEWPHEASIDEEPERHEAYYSRFQIYPLAHVVNMLTLQTQLEWAVEPDGSLNPKWGAPSRDRAAKYAAATVRSLQGVRSDDIKAALAQIIANRFYFSTQSDGRRLTIRQHHGWDWHEYSRAWRAQPILDAFDIDEEASKGCYQRLDLEWSNLDPIENWYKLARFVKVDKRKRLKDDALHALTLRDMAEMVRLFHKEAFDQDLKPLGEVGVHVIRRVPDVDPETDPMRALELIANDFGVNAKPQLALFVEGETEQTVLPVIFERFWGVTVSRCGIEILSLGGVDNAAGGKEAPFSALWRLVDYLHHHQTLAFVLLDNEGFASRNVQQGLPKAKSVHSSDRKATRPDHIKVWRTNFELENFSDTELAQAMNTLCGQRMFNRADVATCRAAVRAGPPKNGPLHTIDRLYIDRTGLPLDKPRLGLILTDIMFDPNTKRKPEARPISRFLDRIASKAALNHQPTTHELWEVNQTSGYLGTLLPSGRARKRALNVHRKQRKMSPK